MQAFKWPTRRGALVGVCLGFTAAAPAWAEDTTRAPVPDPEEVVGGALSGRAPSAQARDDAGVIAALDAVAPTRFGGGPGGSAIDLGVPPIRPLAPARAIGPSLRLGTTVGYVEDAPLDVLALGGTVGAGYRFDRLAFEAEYAYLQFQSHGAAPVAVGHGHRLGVFARLDVARTGHGTLGKNTRLVAYGEVGVARQANRWDRPAFTERERLVPVASSHAEGSVGVGLRIDHGVRYPVGFPHRLGWMIGWRAVAAPHEAVPMTLCRGGSSCSPAPQMPSPTTGRIYGTALLFTTGFEATW
ncbi:MAG: hypothetical protein R2939_03720 [Kofleriaceae bacterium]